MDETTATIVAADQLHRILTATIAVCESGDPYSEATIRLETAPDGCLAALTEEAGTTAAAAAQAAGTALEPIHLSAATARVLLPVLADQIDSCSPESEVFLAVAEAHHWRPLLHVDVDGCSQISVRGEEGPVDGAQWRTDLAAASVRPLVAGRAVLGADQQRLLAALGDETGVSTTLRANESGDEDGAVVLVESDRLCAALMVGREARPGHGLAASLTAEPAAAG